MPTSERLEQLRSLWWDEDHEEWREQLTPEEQEIVADWDRGYCKSVCRLCQEILACESYN